MAVRERHTPVYRAGHASISPLVEHTPHLVATPPSALCEVCITIPARDEAVGIADTLEALARQTHLDGAPLPAQRFEVIVLANNCADDTSARARAFGYQHPSFTLHVVDLQLAAGDAHVGRARRILMDEAYRRLLSLRKPGGVIASTDADTRVDPRWVAGLLAEFAAGADAVGGRIAVDPTELARVHPRARRYHLWDVGYRFLVSELEARIDPDPHDPWPRHFQHFGPSLALTAAAYGAIGGLPVQPYLEDVALYDALVRWDARFRHSPLVRVTTSARPDGRTEFGFAVQLDLWKRMSDQQRPFLVPSACEIEAAATVRRSIRAAWQAAGGCHGGTPASLGQLAGMGAVEPEFLADELSRAPTFGRLMQILTARQAATGAWRARWPLVDIRQAIHELRIRVAGARSVAASAGFLQQVEAIRLEALPSEVA